MTHVHALVNFSTNEAKVCVQTKSCKFQFLEIGDRKQTVCSVKVNVKLAVTATLSEQSILFNFITSD